MTTTPPNSAVDLNNTAVSYLQEGNYREAVMALWTVEKAFPATVDEGSQGRIRVKSVPIAPSSNTIESENVFDFYRRVFQIVSAGDQHHSSIHSISCLIVVKFNMAIAYHDDAVRRNFYSHFVRALELYEDILYLMKDHGIKGHMLLLMAIGNNMGHIQCHFLNYPQTREALYWVRQLAIECRQHASTIPYDDYMFFYNTVIIFSGNDLTVAPAA